MNPMSPSPTTENFFIRHATAIAIGTVTVLDAAGDAGVLAPVDRRAPKPKAGWCTHMKSSKATSKHCLASLRMPKPANAVICSRVMRNIWSLTKNVRSGMVQAQIRLQILGYSQQVAHCKQHRSIAQELTVHTESDAG